MSTRDSQSFSILINYIYPETCPSTELTGTGWPVGKLVKSLLAAKAGNVLPMHVAGTGWSIKQILHIFVPSLINFSTETPTTSAAFPLALCSTWQYAILDAAVKIRVSPSCSSVLCRGLPILSKHDGRGGREVQAAAYLPDSVLWHRTTDILRACVVTSWDKIIRILIFPSCVQWKWKAYSHKNLKWPMLAKFWDAATWAAIHLPPYSYIHSIFTPYKPPYSGYSIFSEGDA